MACWKNEPFTSFLPLSYNLFKFSLKKPPEIIIIIINFSKKERKLGEKVKKKKCQNQAKGARKNKRKCRKCAI